MTHIADARVLIIATHGFEQSELEVPRDKLREAGAEVHGWIRRSSRTRASSPAAARRISTRSLRRSSKKFARVAMRVGARRGDLGL